MTDIARLPFGSADRPEEQGALVLSDDGTVRIEPSEGLRDALAEREEEALARAETYGTRLGLGLVALGLAAVAAGWYAGRVSGKYASRLIWPRPVRDVSVTRTAEGSLCVTLGKTAWTSGVCTAADVEQFSQRLKGVKGDA